MLIKAYLTLFHERALDITTTTTTTTILFYRYRLYKGLVPQIARKLVEAGQDKKITVNFKHARIHIRGYIGKEAFTPHWL